MRLRCAGAEHNHWQCANPRQGLGPLPRSDTTDNNKYQTHRSGNTILTCCARHNETETWISYCPGGNESKTQGSRSSSPGFPMVPSGAQFSWLPCGVAQERRSFSPVAPQQLVLSKLQYGAGHSSHRALTDAISSFCPTMRSYSIVRSNI